MVLKTITRILLGKEVVEVRKKYDEMITRKQHEKQNYNEQDIKILTKQFKNLKSKCLSCSMYKEKDKLKKGE